MSGFDPQRKSSAYSPNRAKSHAMSPPATPAPVWFVAALIPMLASQFVRLHQHDVGAWVFWDYVGRLGGLAILADIPSARAVAFRWEPLRMALWRVALWIAGIVVADHYLGGWARRTINTALPASVLGAYPQLSGWLYLLDVVFGLALVAYSEEIVFRRCARHVFQTYLGDGYPMVLLTSLLFGAYHWWTGAGNIVEATMMGVLLMLFFRRSAALWPVVLGHYLTDIVDFA
jgi:CAAX protease family protein